MKSTAWLMACLGMLASAQARAQRCTGEALGSIGLAARVGSQLQAISDDEVPYTFNHADCECASHDFAAEVQLEQALPAGTTGTAEVWIGTGCDDATVRMSSGQTQCEKIATLDLAPFVQGSMSSGPIDIPIPAQALSSPQLHSCAVPFASNTIYVFLMTGETTPSAVCSLPLPLPNQGPLAPADVTAQAGDGEVTISWAAPGQGPPPGAASLYQVLAADADGQPIAGLGGFSPVYSICANGVLEDLSAPNAPPPGTAPGTFEQLDWRYVASNRVYLPTTSQRIANLQNGKLYQFIVLAIDPNGNATASTVVSATPGSAPPPDLHDGGCSIGGASSTSGLFLFLFLFLGLGALVASRRRA